MMKRYEIQCHSLDTGAERVFGSYGNNEAEAVRWIKKVIRQLSGRWRVKGTDKGTIAI